jgi:hypothetical protein
VHGSILLHEVHVTSNVSPRGDLGGILLHEVHVTSSVSPRGDLGGSPYRTASEEGTFSTWRFGGEGSPYETESGKVTFFLYNI